MRKKRLKKAKKQAPKSGLGDRQVGAFSVFWPGHTGTPFIFCPFLPFFRFFCRFRGWCNTGAGLPCFSSSPICPPPTLS